MDVIITGTITPTCHPGREAFSVKPGEDPVYVLGRRLDGAPDAAMPRIMVKSPVADVVLCLECWKARHRYGATEP